MIRVVLDWETAYGKHPVTGENITLSKMTTEEYVRHPLFKIHGLGVKIGADRAFYLYKKDDLLHFLRTHPWDKTYAIAHHAQFDTAILSWRCGIVPAFIGDTLSMGRAIFPNESVSLSRLAKLLRVGEKGHELANFQGKWTLTDAEQQVLGSYCCNDVELTSDIFDALKGHFPIEELKLIDWTIKAFAEPVLTVDRAPLIQAYKAERRRKRALLEQCNTDGSVLASNDQFAALLLTLGVDPPKKLSPSKVKDGRVDPDAVSEPPLGLLPSFKAPKGATVEDRVKLKATKDAYPWAYAFGKSDELFKMLLDHPDPQVQAVVEARLGVKSTIKETRSKRFYKIGKRGRFPVYLNYYGGHTGRFSGGDKQNAQNLNRPDPKDLTAGALRMSLCAPEGHVVCVRDLGQIECLCEGTKVLTLQRGYVKIERISKTDLLWDGVEWVSHDGVICKGEKRVITYAGLTATPNHIVYTTDGRRVYFEEAKITGAALAVGERDGETVRYMEGVANADSVGGERRKSVVSVRSAWLQCCSTCPYCRPPQREDKRMWEAPQRERVLPLYPKGSVPEVAATVQPNPRSDEPEHDQSGVPIISEEGNKKQVPIGGELCSVYVGEPTSPNVCWGGDRPYRQQQALRTGESSTGNQGGECTEPRLQFLCHLEWGADERTPLCSRGQTPFPCVLRLRDAQERSYPRANNCSPTHATAGGNLNQAKVYDILNAGPRNRFTANGVIVSNCRVLVYWAGQEDMLDMFRKGGDPYNFMATKVYGREVDRRNNPDDKNPGQVGKIVVLGAGYQMGAWKLQENIRVGFMGMDGFLFDQSYVEQLNVDVEGFKYQRAYRPGYQFAYELAEACKPLNVNLDDHLRHCAVTKHLIDTFRRENPQVVALWKECQEGLKLILAGMEAQLGERGLIFTCPEGLLLPNGMKIRYSGLRLSSDGKEYKYLANARKKEWTKIYAGKVVENGVQALSRIILTDQKLRIINNLRDYHLHKGEVAKVVSSTHDEIISVVPYRYAEECLEMMNVEMRTPPAWCADLPLKSSGGYAVSYGECEK